MPTRGFLLSPIRPGGANFERLTFAGGAVKHEHGKKISQGKVERIHHAN
jgi:hypothetical protein